MIADPSNWSTTGWDKSSRPLDTRVLRPDTTGCPRNIVLVGTSFLETQVPPTKWTEHTHEWDDVGVFCRGIFCSHSFLNAPRRLLSFGMRGNVTAWQTCTSPLQFFGSAQATLLINKSTCFLLYTRKQASLAPVSPVTTSWNYTGPVRLGGHRCDY